LILTQKNNEKVQAFVELIKDGIDKGIRCMIGFMRSDDIQAQLDAINLINKVQANKRVFIASIKALKFFGWSEFKLFESYDSMNVGKDQIVKNDQYFKQCPEAEEKHGMGEKYNAPSHLEVAVLLSQEVKYQSISCLRKTNVPFLMNETGVYQALESFGISTS
jgi:excinuclease UvrABC nuclease subunit